MATQEEAEDHAEALLALADTIIADGPADPFDTPPVSAKQHLIKNYSAYPFAARAMFRDLESGTAFALKPSPGGKVYDSQIVVCETGNEVWILARLKR